MSLNLWQFSLVSCVSFLLVNSKSVDIEILDGNFLIDCINITQKTCISELKDLPATGITALLFTHATGIFDVDVSVYPNLAQVRSLAIYDSNIIHFEVKSKALRSLKLVNTRLTDLDDFENCCQYLEKLYLKNNSGFEIGSRTFAGLNYLKKLKIVNQPLIHISRQTFQGLHRLKRLTLYNTTVTSIDEGAFISLNHLKELYVQDHTVEYIDRNVFQPLEGLQSLTIYSNSLKPLTLDHFEKQKKLEQLGLPLETWRHIDIKQIPVVFPKLYSFTYIGNWKSEDDKQYFERLFLELHSLLIGR